MTQSSILVSVEHGELPFYFSVLDQWALAEIQQSLRSFVRRQSDFTGARRDVDLSVRVQSGEVVR